MRMIMDKRKLFILCCVMLVVILLMEPAFCGITDQQIKAASKSLYVLRDFKCYMSVTLNLDTTVDLAIKKVTEIKKQILATLAVVGVANRVMNADDLIRFLNGIFNSDFESTNPASRNMIRLVSKSLLTIPILLWKTIY